jgi:enoyl-CoA hydratase
VVEVTTAGPGVRLITLNRPAARNAMNAQLSRELSVTMQEAHDDPAVQVIVLTGRDPAFCAGADLAELARSGFDGSARRSDCIAALTATAKPVIGAINGPAVTGGLELALACDFLVASERAWFADTHARVGVVPGSGLTARLPQAVGLRRAKQLSLTGMRLPAGTALKWGLVNEVVAHEQLLPRAVEAATSIVGADPRVIRELRALYDLGAAGTFAESLQRERAANESWRVSGDHMRNRTR